MNKGIWVRANVFLFHYWSVVCFWKIRIIFCVLVWISLLVIANNQDHNRNNLNLNYDTSSSISNSDSSSPHSKLNLIQSNVLQKTTLTHLQCKQNPSYGQDESVSKQLSEINRKEYQNKWKDYLKQNTIKYELAKWGARSKSIVTSYNPKHFSRIKFLLNYIRNYLNCQLSIEIFYYGDEINTLQHQVLIEFGEVYMRDISSVVNYSVGSGRGFALKSGALLNSFAEQNLWLDSDNIPLRDPSYLFDSAEFKSTGAIFWPDYWHQSISNPVFDILNVTCYHEQYQQESGQLLVDRSIHWESLKLSYYINENSDLYYRFFLGDKESFHLAWKALNSPFYFIHKWLSPVGFMESNGRFCGHAMLQYDYNHQPLFLHANLLKSFEKSTFLNNKYWTHIQRYVADIDNPDLEATVIGRENDQKGLCVVLHKEELSSVIESFEQLVPDFNKIFSKFGGIV